MNFHEFSMQQMYSILVGFEKDIREQTVFYENGETAQTLIFMQENTCRRAFVKGGKDQLT